MAIPPAAASSYTKIGMNMSKNPYEASKGATGDASSFDADQVVPSRYVYPFILVTTLFALWGFANDITNPLVRAFKEIFLISNAQSSLVQWAFYGGYATMAIPAALVIRKLSYKSGIVIGLLLYAIGALLTIPASLFMEFNIFLIGFYILTFGLAFLETTANPYILSMGSPATATQRLNLAQAFNPIGSLTGMVVASIDTGVRYTHNALVNQYRGNLGGGSFSHDYNWLDADAFDGDSPTPFDDHGHGSHTVGTMVGDDGGANQIGMAPGAEWIACDACDTTYGCSGAALLTCAQWIAAPYPIC